MRAPAPRRTRPAGRLAAVLLVIAACLAAAARPAGANAVAAALGRLTRFEIVSGDLRAGVPITRGEFAAMVVLADGRRNRASALAGAVPFLDIIGHPAQGHVAAAAEAGYMTGYPDGRFYPDAHINYAEVATVLVRLAGLAPAADMPWPANYVTVAGDAGIIPRGLLLEPYLMADAVRGAVFVLLDSALLEVRPTGQNLYQTHHDSVPPTLSVDPQPAETKEWYISTAGQVGGAVTVTVDGVAAPIGEDGRFQQFTTLQVGHNEVPVEAVDDVGNVTRVVVQILRLRPDNHGENPPQ